MNKIFRWHAAATLLTLSCHVSLAADDRFDIQRFQVDGNNLLSEADIQRAVGPLAGTGKSYADIQKALDALDVAYHNAGFSSVHIRVPEQELTGGVVVIRVSESTIGTIAVAGNKHFDEPNIRSSLRALRPAQPFNLHALSEAIQLANDNPAKQVEVTLVSGAQDNTVDARVAVTDRAPIRVSLTVDNTGTPASGTWRTGVALQHANLFNLDHVATIAYTTSPDSPHGVQVDLWSVGYRVPLYDFGDSLDLVYGNSSVNSPGASPTLGGLLGIVGKGDVVGARWNHFLARQGNYTSKVVASVDRKDINSRCSVNGVEVSYAPPTPPISTCVPYSTMPVGVTYSGRLQTARGLFDVSAGLARNVGTGTRYTTDNGRTDRYSYLTPGNRNTRDGFMMLRGGVNFFATFASDWQTRLAANGQLASDPLVGSEQFGLVGSTSVRGFNERVLGADSGIVGNAEVYTPELGGHGIPGSLRLLAFYDIGRGHNLAAGSGAVPQQVHVASAGFGIRYTASKDFDLRTDVARISDAGPSTTESRGAWKAHVGMVLGF